MKSNVKALAIGILVVLAVPAALAAIGFAGDWAGSAAVGALAEFYAEKLPIPLLIFHGLSYFGFVVGFTWICWNIGLAIVGQPKPEGRGAKIIHLKK